MLFAVVSLLAVTLVAACSSGQVLKPDPAYLTPAAQTSTAASNAVPSAPKTKLQLASPAFTDNASIPQKYTCDGEDKSPPLAISGVSANAAGLALIVTDLDGPGGNFVHWVVWNINPTTREIPEGAVPQVSVEGRNSLNGNSFAAPCPPTGVHHYVFELYALSQEVELGTAAGKGALLSEMNSHIIDQAQLTGTYTRATPGAIAP